MDVKSVDMLNVWPEMPTGVQLLMFPTTAAGTDSGSDLPTLSLVRQDATVDFASAWTTTNDILLMWLI